MSQRIAPFLTILTFLVAASMQVTAAPPASVPIVGAYIQSQVRFGGVGGSSMTIDHILLYGNGIAVRTGVINGAIECYVAMPVTNLKDLPFNYGRWREDKARNAIEIQWREGPSWQLKREGGSLSLEGRKLSVLRPLEPAKFHGAFAYKPVGDTPSIIVLANDGSFATRNLRDTMFCGGRAPPDGEGWYEVRQWTLILRYGNGTVAMMPLHIRPDEDLGAVKKFWVKSYEFEPIQ
jgi:hypothetical protein